MARKSAATKKAEQEQELENARQEVFCRFYAQNNELFGNGTNSYAEAYGYDLESLSKEDIYDATPDEDGNIMQGEIIEESPYKKACNVCAVEASKLLRKPKIQERITVLRNEWLTDATVDGELASVIQQNVKLERKRCSQPTLTGHAGILA